jgi:ABC-type amino acid transport substrate-binding protein
VVRKGQHGELLTRLDRGVAAIKADGMWQAIFSDWMQR